MRRAVPFLLIPLLATGCRNPCQRLCVRMKAFAEECGYTVSDAELEQCIEEQDISSSEDRQTCREAGDVGTIERNWDCDTVADYWGQAGTSG